MIKTVLLSDSLDRAVLASVNPEVLKILLGNLASAGRAYWVKQAGAKLTSSRRDYIAGIQQVTVDGLTATIELVGKFPNMIEQGASSWDMKDSLLGPSVPVVSGPGQKGKMRAKDGSFYRAIPFKHQTPGTAGLGGGAPMGTSYAAHPLVQDAAKLGKMIHGEAKKLAPSTNGGWGGRLPPGLAPKLKNAHATDIYAGMVRLEKSYGSATQSSYATFRMISSKPDGKWIHPGLEAADISSDVDRYIRGIADAALEVLLHNV